MGYRRFPADGRKRQLKNARTCCRKPENWKAWDCGCSWGCEMCWADTECSVCGGYHSRKTLESVVNTQGGEG